MIFTNIPVSSENSMIKLRYRRKCRIPITILSAPRFVIFVAGPVRMQGEADPGLIPLISHSRRSGIVPAAGVERHADGRRHQDAPGFIPAEYPCHQILRYSAGNRADRRIPKKKVQLGRPDVPPDVQQIPDEQIRMRIAACRAEP